MSTVAPAKVLTEHVEHQPDIRIYGHSTLLYWWPVWALGFVLALGTYLDNYHLALVPQGTVAEGNRLVAPDGTELAPQVEHVARSTVPGALFVVTLLLTIVFSNASLRGPWALLFATSLVALVLLVNWLHGWGPLYGWLRLLRIHLNLGGYLAIAFPLALIWAATVFVFDRRTYLVFSASQLRVCDRLGEEAKVFDGSRVAFEKRPYNWFHRLVGCGAGDIVLRAGGADREVYELPNVVRVGKWLEKIEYRLKTRDVE